jgi:tetratricopeptide (TPR) repeat protein
MNDLENQVNITSIKCRIEKLIDEGHINEAMSALENLDERMPGDQDVYSMMSVIYIMKDELDKAESIIAKGLEQDLFHFDLLYNYAYVFEMRKLYQRSADLYNKASTMADDENKKLIISEAIQRVKAIGENIIIQDKSISSGQSNMGTDNP